MSESNLTPHTAPRTLEQLMAETPFKLRLLLTDLGGLKTEEQKMAWHQLNNAEARANHVLALLKAWDQANPGAATPPAAPPPQANGVHQPVPQQPPPQAFQPPPQAFQPPMGQPAFQQPPPQQAPQGFPQNGFVPPQGGFVAPQPIAPVPAQVAGAPGGPPPVSPQAAAAATQATQAETGKGGSKRQPRTSGAAGDAELGAQVLGMLQTILQGLGTEAESRQAWQKQLTEMLEEAATGKASRVTALEQKYAELTQVLASVSQALQNQQQLQIWTLMAFLTLAEQQTGGSVVQILGQAISDSPMFSKFVDQATGKA